MSDCRDVNNSKVGCSSSNSSRVPNEGSKFYLTAPRPPVPGEEGSRSVSDWGQPHQMELGRKQDGDKIPLAIPPRSAPSVPPQLPPKPVVSQAKKMKPPPPGVTPLKEKEAPPTPPCIKWAQSLLNLLNDSDGVAHFMDYLEGEGPHHAEALRFWLACEGARKEDQQDKAQIFAQAIFRFFVQSPLLPIDENLRAQISAALNSEEPLDIPVTIFDDAQLQVENVINTTTYPNFLQSEIYLQCLQSAQATPPAPYEEDDDDDDDEEDLEESCSEFEELQKLASVASLPTLHEDLEYIPKLTPHPQTAGTVSHAPSVSHPLKLTKDLLLLSQQHRASDLRPQSEAYASSFPYRIMGAHAAYNSYNPVSRQDSEMQSLSSRSDARTESDNMSMTDSSVCGRGVSKTTKRKTVLKPKRENKEPKEEQESERTVIESQADNIPFVPRFQRENARKAEPPKDPQQFASILIEKLETIDENEVELELHRRFRIMENDSVSIQEDKHRIEPQSRALANVLKEKLLLLQPEDDDDQDILDQHVSRVFSDLTPSRSPGVASPRPHSPHRSRYPLPMSRPKRRDKDGYSTFSGDSGNVHDFQEGSEHHLSMVKSKSMPEYSEERFARSSASRRSASRKTMTELTDSGVSVVSDTPPVVPPAVKDNRVLTWLMEADRSTKSQSGTHSELSSGKHSRHRAKGFVGSRSDSLERGAVAETLGPSQPFIADTNIPVPPLPNTNNQLEEARRKLLVDDVKSRSRVRSSNKYYPDMTQSGQSTIRRSTRGARPSVPGTGAATPDEYTTVVFSYADEQFPYRIKIPGCQVTFKQFKEYLPKKGNYRYFFKTVCEELNNQVIQEELNKDSDLLPLCEGKVMALAKPID